MDANKTYREKAIWEKNTVLNPSWINPSTKEQLYDHWLLCVDTILLASQQKLTKIVLSRDTRRNLEGIPEEMDGDEEGTPRC